MTEAKDYRDTVFLPKTDFPMKAGLPVKEPGILAKWQGLDLYRELRNRRAGREKFILHDGPPYANGDMHIGHALNHILKDTVCRTQSLLGKDAPYVPGWDCHGLPIEWKVEEQYRKKKLNKDEVPVKEFRAECRAYAQNWVDVQREQLKRLGINGDWDNPYLTMDFDAEAVIVTELMKFAESGQLYRGAKPVMWSPVEKTALAEAEVEYEDIISTQIDVAFEIVSSPNCPAIQKLLDQGEKVSAVIWTTTPWTIPVNQAIAYGADVEYALVHLRRNTPVWDGDHVDLGVINSNAEDFGWVILALQNNGSLGLVNANHHKDQLIRAFEHRSGYSVLLDSSAKVFKGSDLAGTMARHPMAGRFKNPSPLAGEERDLARNELSRSGEGALSLDSGAPDPSPSLASRASPSPARGEGFFDRPRPFLDGSAFVTTDTGTGLVHMSPDHGEDDFDLCKANGIEPVFAVEGDGKYRADWAWLGGQGSVINPKFNAPDGPICEALRESGGLLAASADYKHSYPHSWRSKAKVIYRCTPQWFVPMDREKGTVTKVTVPTPTLPTPTLRSAALSAIEATRWVPEKGRNRINSMVEGRPDWVLSRQRAWGVPITLFVDRKSGQYLYDEAVNARIIAGVKAQGVDAWCDENAQSFLGSDYKFEDYERVVDILDVWFDSGCTHAFVLESGKWPDLTRPADHVGPWADLYLEGSDQHRGWFQSSLLESCGTRGHAPYKAVLTHGFTMDQKGMKMSKSLGNTISPTDLMRDSGADILRLWALSVDFTEDHRIGKEILSGVSDQYRKLRNTFRYMLGALEGFSEAERVNIGKVTGAEKGTVTLVTVLELPELERYVLHLLADMDGKLKQAVNDFDFNTYVRLITDFANNDLSAFFFDIRKDSLYCDAVTDPKRMAYRTVLDILFHALVRYAAPVLVFTAEEVWQTRFPDASESVHFLDWPEVDAGWSNDDLAGTWSALRDLRRQVTEAIEPLRRDKTIGSSLEATISVRVSAGNRMESIVTSGVDFAELFITSAANVDVGLIDASEELQSLTVERTTHHKCGRCWRHLPEVVVDGALCGRCDDVVND